MTQAAKRFTFEEYLNLEDLDDLPEGRCEFIHGELVKLPLESELNNFIARHLVFMIATRAGLSLRLVINHACEIQVPRLNITRKNHTPRTDL